ncbi:hypothetical protein PG995_008671 [Apiospora arundinis]
MAGIHELPWELMLQVLDNIDDDNDWASLARVRTDFYDIATDKIWNKVRSPNDLKKRCMIFLMACATGSTRAVHRLFEMGLNPNLYFLDKSYYGSMYTPSYYLHYSDKNDVLPDQNVFPHTLQLPLKHIVDILLQKGVWADAPSRGYAPVDRPWKGDKWQGKHTPLYLAMYEGHEEIAKSLILHGASLYVDHRIIYTDQSESHPERGRITAFHLCAFKGLESVARLLITEGHGAAINELDEYGLSPLMYAYNFNQDGLFDFLLAQGASPRVTKHEACDIARWIPTLLYQACLDHRWEIVAKLLKCGIDPLEPDDEGFQPLSYCTSVFRRGSWNSPENEREQAALQKKAQLQNMISALESCKLHVGVNKQTLERVSGNALLLGLHSLLSLLLDTGLDISIQLESRQVIMRREIRVRPDIHTELTAWDPFTYYHDTGMNMARMSMIDIACYMFDPFLNMEEIIDVLMARGCIKPGDICSHVRALKNLCCYDPHPWDGYRDPDCDPISPILRHCAQSICSHLLSTAQKGSEKPQIPFDLLYVCFDFGHRVILEELLKVFDLNYANYSEDEMWRLLEGMMRQDAPDIQRRACCLELLLQEDKDGHILQHDQTFRRLCEMFSRSSHCEGENAILDYLDRGGRYNFVFEDGSTALIAATDVGRLKLTERLLDLGADPNKFCTHKNPDNYYLWSDSPLHSWEARAPALIRLLVERGFNPFRMAEENPGLISLFEQFMQNEEEDLFRELCQLTINDDIDDGDLFDILHFACVRGRYKYVQHVRLHAKSRVDAIIGAKAALFLQQLLVNISPLCESPPRWVNTIMDMDDVIDTIGLILQLGPRSTLTSSWRLRLGREDFTVLKVLRKLLIPPENPHDSQPEGKWEECDWMDRHYYKIYWCLKERIKIHSDSGRSIVTIRGRRIEWPKEFEGPADSEEYAEEMHGVFDRLRVPWDYSAGFMSLGGRL